MAEGTGPDLQVVERLKIEFLTDPAGLRYNQLVSACTDIEAKCHVAWDLFCISPHAKEFHGQGPDGDGCIYCNAGLPATGSNRRLAVLGAPEGSLLEVLTALEALGW